MNRRSWDVGIEPWTEGATRIESPIFHLTLNQDIERRFYDS